MVLVLVVFIIIQVTFNTRVPAKCAHAVFDYNSSTGCYMHHGHCDQEERCLDILELKADDNKMQ